MADGLYESKDQIYPGQNLTLTCNTTVNNAIKWTMNGNELKNSDRHLIKQNVLIVKNATPEDSGKLPLFKALITVFPNIANKYIHYIIV